MKWPTYDCKYYNTACPLHRTPSPWSLPLWALPHRLDWLQHGALPHPSPVSMARHVFTPSIVEQCKGHFLEYPQSMGVARQAYSSVGVIPRSRFFRFRPRGRFCFRHRLSGGFLRRLFN